METCFWIRILMPGPAKCGLHMFDLWWASEEVFCKSMKWLFLISIIWFYQIYCSRSEIKNTLFLRSCCLQQSGHQEHNWKVKQKLLSILKVLLEGAFREFWDFKKNFLANINQFHLNLFTCRFLIIKKRCCETLKFLSCLFEYFLANYELLTILSLSSPVVIHGHFTYYRIGVVHKLRRVKIGNSI